MPSAATAPRANSRAPSRSSSCAACSSKAPSTISCSATRSTRPTLAAAAALGVPVFVHPLTDPQLHKRFSGTGRIGVRLARGTINNAALISMLEGGTFDEVPKLQVVMTTLAMGGMLLAGGFGDGSGIRSDAPALTRRHVYVDTMGIHPAVVRCAVDLLGADHVLMGTDWPIVVEKSVPERLQKAFAHCGLTAAEQQMIASGNTLKLLGRGLIHRTKGNDMSKELYWLVLTAAMTGLLWVPYILDRIMVRGPMGATANPSPNDKPQSAWAERMMAAHTNTVENLVVFAPLALVAQALNIHTATTALACALFFWCRLIYIVVYTAGIPVLRTLAFAGGWIAQMMLVLAIFGMI